MAAHTTAPGIPADDRRRLDFVIYGLRRDAAPKSFLLRYAEKARWTKHQLLACRNLMAGASAPFLVPHPPDQPWVVVVVEHGRLLTCNLYRHV